MAETIHDFRSIVQDPVQAYRDMRDRLDTYGPNAPFPEFKPAVDYVVGQMALPQYVDVLADHPDLGLEKKEVDTLLAHTNLAFVFDDEAAYPYDRPFMGPYPYRPTIDAIESGLRLLDKYSRLAPNSSAVPLYHFDRYAYHRHALFADPNVVIMPTAEIIGYDDFIRTRAVPIGFIGLTGTVIRVDRHQQSPLDFWYHDINHVRRMAGYTKQSEQRHGAHTPAEKLALYQSMDDFIVQKLMPATAKLPEGASESDKAVRKLVRVILFEVLHETALTPEREVILADILRESIPQPFEHMVAASMPSTASETEKLRTPTGNLQSGISVMGDRADGPITIRYFHDRALALLANVYNKLNFGFYDDPTSPRNFVAPPQYRTPEYLVKAVREIFAALDYTDGPSDEYLLGLICSREGSEEKFIYQGVASTEAENLPHTTEPLPPAQIIRQIKDMGKQVVSLVGFADSGYQQPDRVLAQVEEKLQTFDPENTIINIGATDEGIGAAYVVAKKLGFTTLGVVSHAALTNSGHFSKDADTICIVNDDRWGGYAPGTNQPVPTTEVILAVSDEIHAFGGGDITKVVLAEADKRGIPSTHTPAARKSAGHRE